MFEVNGALKWLHEGMAVDIMMYDDAPISADIPSSMTVRVTDTPEDRISEAGAKKPAVCATGATVMVPAYVQNGDDIVVNTVTGDFVRRVAA